MTSSIAIRDLAEMVHRCGDLYAGGRGRTTGEEGIATQRVLQRKRLDASEHYQREVSVSACVEIAGAQMLLKGRVDGLDLNATPARVEEFKTTRQSAEQAYQRDGVVHFAQLKLYAALLAISHPDHKRFALVVLYCHPETLQVHECVEVLGREALAAFLAQTLEAHGAVLRRYREHVWARDAWVDELTFPYAAYRPHQLAMARRCFTTLRDARSLLIEAPTGSGKTMGVLYPALKSLPATHARRLLFLTSRTTGAAAVHAAVRHIDPASDRLRSVHIIAREAACLVEGMPCDPERCEYARGYYDRREVALDALLAHGMIGAEQTRDIAERYRVCPFELSLDAALWADLLVLDCNYVFDPVVMLQRFAGDENSDLLVDEAHQLAPRVRDMLSAELDLSVIRSARHGAVPGTAIKRLDSIARAMTTLRRLYGHNEIMEVDQPLAVSRACERFMTSWQEEQWPTDLDAALSEALWHVKRWLRAEAWSDEVRFRHVLDTGSKNVSLRLVCLDASRHIRNVFDGFRSHIRFSGTLTPLELYQDQHGFKDDDIERVASAYVSEQLCTLIVDDVSTLYRRRGESLPRLVRLVEDLTTAHPGRYLLAFPSYEYLESFRDAFDARGDTTPLLCQQRDMDLDARASYLRKISETRVITACIVLGGVFSESVDFSNASLDGVVVVGVGLPPPELVRRSMQRYFDEKGSDGRGIAFVQPAMSKVLQVAGRLLRSPDDLGVLCLVDARFAQRDYARFFPEHWQAVRVGHLEVAEKVAKFWRGRILTASAASTP